MSASASVEKAPASFGLSTYPDGVVWFVPYALGVRAPFAAPAPGGTEDQYNQAYGHGAYDASVRVGIGALVLGAALGALGTWLALR